MINSRIIERAYPYAISICVALLIWSEGFAPAQGKSDGLLTAAISVSAILMGFLGTAKAMLLSFSSSRFAWMKTNQMVWKLLLGYLRAAFRLSMISCAASLALLSLDQAKLPPAATPVVFPFWAGLFILSGLTFYRVVAVFFSLLAAEGASKR